MGKLSSNSRIRSWLAKAKSVHDLGHPIYIPKPVHSWDEEREERIQEKWTQLMRKPLPVDAEFSQFFGSRMHDSWVIGIERTPSILKVRLDSIDADIFAWNLTDELGIAIIPSQWPVELLLHDPVYVRAARHDPFGMLRFADLRLIKSDEPQKGSQFLYDWFIEQDGRIQWIAELWSYSKNRGKPSTSIYLMVDCTRASALDLRENAVRKAYGDAGAALWRDVTIGSEDCPRFKGIWGMETMRDFLRERIWFHKFAEADFMPIHREAEHDSTQ